MQMEKDRRSRVSWIVGLACLAALALPTLAWTAPGGSPPTITPAHGKSFHPALGDWEGTVGGFPVSFQVKLTGVKLASATAAAHYSLNAIVALLPAGCPKVSYRYTEAVINSTSGTAVGAHGQFGLTKFGFTGSFTGPRSATLSSPPGAHHCSPLSWTLHPVKRAPVRSGTWRISFANNESSRFGVIGNGRLAAGIKLPQALTRCNGASGAIDLFIGASGRAMTDQPRVRASIRFGLTRATGQINAGGKGCPSGPLSFTARRL
ncbi:MAG: hypothetical protein ACRDNK_02945 [Solirubrobacteraceae bacterium]